MSVVARARIALLVVAVFVLITPRGQAQSTDMEMPDDVKAAYLLKFARYVTWPEESYGDIALPIVIGVVGNEQLARSLESIVADRTVRGRSIEVQRFASTLDAAVDMDALATCHVAFVTAPESSDIAKWLTTLSGMDVLTVSDLNQFAAMGGMIELLIEEGRIVFEVNRSAAEDAGLKLSARLLRLAKLTGEEE